VTGASRGVGRAIAEHLGPDGYDLRISARAALRWPSKPTM
jgi:short-subunit dehydrogenase